MHLKDWIAKARALLGGVAFHGNGGNKGPTRTACGEFVEHVGDLRESFEAHFDALEEPLRQAAKARAESEAAAAAAEEAKLAAERAAAAQAEMERRAAEEKAAAEK